MQIDSRATVLVTGATGFVGRALIHQLSTRGCRIKVLARAGSEANTLAVNYGAELVHGDILSRTTAESACAEVTHIFHLAGRGQSHSSTKSDAETRRVNVNGTKMLARCAAEMPTPPRFVHFSTIAVHGDIEKGPGNEDSPFNATSAYELTKLEAELWLKNYAGSNNLPITILRPCAIVGAGDQRLLKLFRLADRNWVPILGTGKQRYQLIHVDDCARVMLAAAESSIAAGEIYVCGNEQTMTLREILAQVGRAEQRVVSLPVRPVELALKALERLCSACNLRNPLALSSLAFFTDNHWFDTSKLRRDLNPEFEHDNASALAATRRWYQENGLL